ncbi:hypothetical protein DM01DRAFT_1137177 [Hesseltinella vesiculosa]|uniref:Uncharacterized protein n=1 Tax=Hesseltinella vesiculosa TaxID=101127 RepID=A0A1X2G8I7_9FUNG|nr:hypothetical protein DM01DRAFT_1137177 [Hesseltinella vesiculosa]
MWHSPTVRKHSFAFEVFSSAPICLLFTVIKSSRNLRLQWENQQHHHRPPQPFGRVSTVMAMFTIALYLPRFRPYKKKKMKHRICCHPVFSSYPGFLPIYDQ